MRSPMARAENGGSAAPAVWDLTAAGVAPLMNHARQRGGRLRSEAGPDAPLVPREHLAEESFITLQTCGDGACGLHAFLGRPRGGDG